MKFLLFGIILLVQCSVCASQSCSLLSNMTGSWLTSDMETVTISQTTPTLTMNITIIGSGQTSMDFDCILVDGDRYILQSKTQVATFSGTHPIYMYMCVQFTAASNISVMYTLYAAPEPAFGDRRFVGLQNTTVVTSSSQVCTATPDIATYGVMIKVGNESQLTSVYQCPDSLLGTFNFTSTTVTCTDPQLNACEGEGLTSLRVNTNGCSSNVFFSAAGYLGCIASVYSSSLDTHYTMLYNTDATVDGSATFRFTCLAVYYLNNITYVTYKGTACEAGQLATTAPTDGHKIDLDPSVTCIPTTAVTSSSSSTDYTWLIVLLVLLFVILVVALIALCLYLRYRKKKKEKAREKGMLTDDDHPLGEMSLVLDAPASMERVSENAYVEMGHETMKTPKKRKKEKMHPLMDESCMNIEMSGRRWSKFSNSNVGLSDMDPFTEMDGTVVPISTSRTINDLKNSRRTFSKSKTPRALTNGDAGRPLAITDGSVTGLTLEDMAMYQSINGDVKAPPPKKAPSVMMSRSKTNMSIPRTARSRGAPSVASFRSKTNLTAKPVKEARSIKAPSVVNGSVRGGTPKSVKSIGVANGAVPRASKKPRLIRSSTSTRIGSVTERSASMKKKSVARSNTVILPTKEDEAMDKDNVNTMVAAETGDIVPPPSLVNGDIAPPPSEGGKSRKSKRSLPVTSSGRTPSRSILKKTSAYTSTREFMTQDEIFAEMIQEEGIPPWDESLPHTLRESYLSMKQRFDIRSNTMRPKGSRTPWH